MDVYKLQIDLLKERSKCADRINARYEVTDKGVFVVNFNAAAVYRIPEYSWHLARNVFCSGESLPKQIKDLLELTEEDHPLDFNGRTVEWRKKKYAIFYRQDDKEVYADIALMKYFSPGTRYYKADKPGFIKAVENNVVVGCFGEFLDKRGELK